MPNRATQREPGAFEDLHHPRTGAVTPGVNVNHDVRDAVLLQARIHRAERPLRMLERTEAVHVALGDEAAIPIRDAAVMNGAVVRWY